MDEYGVVSGIAQANARITIVKVLRGDINKAVSTAKGLFEGSAVGNVMAGMEEAENRQ